MKNIEIDNQYAALMLIQILFEKGLINNATYVNVLKQYGASNSHNSQIA